MEQPAVSHETSLLLQSADQRVALAGSGGSPLVLTVDVWFIVVDGWSLELVLMVTYWS